MVEHSLGKGEVMGSSPIESSILRGGTRSTSENGEMAEAGFEFKKLEWVWAVNFL